MYCMLYIYILRNPKQNEILRANQKTAKFEHSAPAPRVERVLAMAHAHRSGWHPMLLLACPEGPSTQCLRLLVPKTIPLMLLGTRILKYWVLGPSGIDHVEVRFKYMIL